MTSPDLTPRLLGYLRKELRVPGLQFAEPPVPISGGYDTRIFAFRLQSAPDPFAGPLILRLLGRQQSPARVLRELAVQNAVATMGYPAPRSLLANADPEPLDGIFLVMERLAGRPLLDARRLGVGRVLVDMQLRLHDLDSGVLLEGLSGESREAMTIDGILTQMDHRIARRSIDGLRAAMGWLRGHRPSVPGRPVICHGDFHPQNILMAGGRVTGVIDWPNAVVAEREFNVAATRTILSLTPAELFTASAPARWVIGLNQSVVTARYLSGYRRRCPLDALRLAYYEAVSCMRGLLRVAESRLSEAAPNALDASSFGGRLASRFALITGLRPALPPARP